MSFSRGLPLYCRDYQERLNSPPGVRAPVVLEAVGLLLPTGRN